MFKKTKEFIAELKEELKENKNGISEEEKREKQQIKNEIMNEYGDEINYYIKLILTGAAILVGGIVLVILLQPFISGQVDRMFLNDGNSSETDNNMGQYDVGDGDSISDSSSISEKLKIDCTKLYNASYKGTYTINGVSYTEDISLSDDGFFTRTINTGEDFGNYTINSNQINLATINDETIIYNVSSDCKKLTRNELGNNIVLDIE